MGRHKVFMVLALSGSLMASACGSGKPAGQGAIRVTSVVHIGPYTQEFAGPMPASPAQAAVVESFREGDVLWGRSEYAQRLVPPVREYVTGQALTHLTGAMKALKANGVVPAGVDRLFMTRVTQIRGRNAVVATCDDGSRYKTENRRTGKVEWTALPSPGQDYLFETWRMVQLSGHWAISSFSLHLLPSASAEPCQPGMAGAGPFRQPDVAALVRQVNATAHAASSVHIDGTILQGGHTLTLNVGLAGSGGFSGMVSAGGLSFTVLHTDGRTYLKLTAAMLRADHLPATVCSRYCGKYAKISAARAHGLVAHVNLAALIRTMTGALTSQVKYLGLVTTGGRRAWLLQDAYRDSVYVAASGKPYILRVVPPLASEGGANLTQWNAVRIPGPPPASQVVNLSQLATGRPSLSAVSGLRMPPSASQD